MRSIAGNFAAWALRAALLLNCHSAAAEGILLLKSRDCPQYNKAVEGFLRHWQDRQTGRVLDQRTLADLQQATPQTELARQTGAIVAFGTEAARWAITNSAGLVVFCMVANARQNLLAGLSKADSQRVAGVSLDIPVKTQFQAVRDLMPEVRRVGVVFDPRKSAPAVQEAQQACAELGLELIAWEVNDESALPGGIQRIAPRIDLLWAPVDSTVFNSRSAQFVLRQMLERKVPVMGFSENMVKAGALLAPRVDYAAVGEQTAELLAATLRGGVGASERIQSPRRFQWVANARVLNLVGKPLAAGSAQTVQMIDED